MDRGVRQVRFRAVPLAGEYVFLRKDRGAAEVSVTVAGRGRLRRGGDVSRPDLFESPLSARVGHHVGCFGNSPVALDFPEEKCIWPSRRRGVSAAPALSSLSEVFPAAKFPNRPLDRFFGRISGKAPILQFFTAQHLIIVVL